jgi:hypothetical protein
MAIGTYAELQTAVANWLDRGDLTDRIVEFIDLAEARMNRNLRLRLMETTATGTLTGGTRDYDLPTDFIQAREFHLTTTPLTPLSYITPELMTRIWGGSTSGTPEVFTVRADKFRLGPAPASGDGYSMLYYKKIPALTPAATTNDMLTNNPDVYLYGCLLEAEPFLMNDERVPLWATAYQQAVTDLQVQDNKDRHSGSELRVMNTGGYY